MILVGGPDDGKEVRDPGGRTVIILHIHGGYPDESALFTAPGGMIAIDDLYRTTIVREEYCVNEARTHAYHASLERKA